MNELKIFHEQMMKTEIDRLNLQADEELEKMVEDMTNRHKGEIKKLQEQFEEDKKDMRDTIGKLFKNQNM